MALAGALTLDKVRMPVNVHSHVIMQGQPHPGTELWQATHKPHCLLQSECVPHNWCWKHYPQLQQCRALALKKSRRPCHREGISAVIKGIGQLSQEWILHKKSSAHPSCSFLHRALQQEDLIAARRPGNGILTLDFPKPKPGSKETSIVYKWPGLWYFVIAAKSSQ